MFSILFVMDEFIRYLWLVIVRTMDFLRTNSCGVAQEKMGMDMGAMARPLLNELKKKNVQISCP